MTHATTVIDCREQCAKFEADCLQRGESTSKCHDERRRCEKSCVFK